MRFLLGPESDELAGAVLLACSDAALEIIIEQREAFARKFVLDISNPDAQRDFLNKLSTYKVAQRANVPTPRFWEAQNESWVRLHANSFPYPLIVKPLNSHAFSKIFGEKFFLAHDERSLIQGFKRARDRGLAVMLVEEVPGPDNRLCSYYTYLDEAGVPQFEFTKRIIRRYPEQTGLGCYHITDWNPEVRDLGLRLVREARLQGLANVEFKRDPRDGKLKLIECNARFTAANGLLTASGYDLGLFVYNRLTGKPQLPLKEKRYLQGRRLWNAGDDFKAFLELRRKGKLDLRTWLRSVLHRQVFYYFRWYDPMPSVALFWRSARRATVQVLTHVVMRRGGRRHD